MPLILPGNVASATAAAGYEVANSCRFDTGDEPNITKDTGAFTLQTKGTISVWCKRGSNIQDASTGETLWYCEKDNNNKHMLYFFDATGEQPADKSELQFYGKSGGSTDMYLKTIMKFRDPTAWYHIVCAFDTTQSTETDRVKIYVNGVLQTGYLGTYPSEDGALGSLTDSSTMYWSLEAYPIGGYLAECVYIDGTAYAASDFGEFDEDSPTIWKPKDPSGLTFGAQGNYLDFEASGNLGNDANGGTDFTQTNLAATDQSIDTPTNNFPTWNVLDKNSTITLSQGSVTPVDSANDTYASRVKSTIAVSSGKWYAEFKYVAVGSSGDVLNPLVGICKQTILNNVNPSTVDNGDVTIRMNRGLFVSATETEDYTPAISNNDIIGIALDMDNGKVYFAVNNTWSNSGDPAGTNPATTGLSGDYAFLARPLAENIVCNFGASPTYANSSDAADANGYGKFEFAPPSGYLALCTKNLGSDGG